MSVLSGDTLEFLLPKERVDTRAHGCLAPLVYLTIISYLG